MLATSNRTRALSPGSYTNANLPPPRPEVQAILERVKAKAAELSISGEEVQFDKSSPGARSINFADEGQRAIRTDDKGQRPIG